MLRFREPVGGTQATRVTLRGPRVSGVVDVSQPYGTKLSCVLTARQCRGLTD